MCTVLPHYVPYSTSSDSLRSRLFSSLQPHRDEVRPCVSAALVLKPCMHPEKYISTRGKGISSEVLSAPPCFPTPPAPFSGMPKGRSLPFVVQHIHLLRFWRSSPTPPVWEHFGRHCSTTAHWRGSGCLPLRTQLHPTLSLFSAALPAYAI